MSETASTPATEPSARVQGVAKMDPRTRRLMRYVWRGVVARCRDPRMQNYQRYGGAGVTVCDRWANSFANFLADMGVRPSQKHSIDRIDNSKGYEPGNCRWATTEQQSRNRTDNRWLTFQGRTMVMEDWAKETGLRVGTIWIRLAVYGWPVERALSERPGEAQRRMIEYQGRRLHLGEWARIVGLRFDTLKNRINAGWSVEKAMSTPARTQGRRG